MSVDAGGGGVRALLTDVLRERRSGALEWREEPRRRLFYFERGELILAQSNLKSESPSRVAEREPGLDAAALAARVAELRLAEALSAVGGQVAWHDAAAAPQREALDLVSLLWRIAERHPPMDPSCWPALATGGAAAIERLSLDPPVAAYLHGLDGTRPLEDVVAFGPAEPTRLERALAVCVLVGAAELLPRPRAAAIVSAGRSGGPTGSVGGAIPVGAPPSAGSGSAFDAGGFSLDDIAGFIQDELGDGPSAAAPVPPAAPAADDEDMNDTFVVRVPRAAPVGVDPVVARFGPKAARIRAAPDHFSALGVSHEDPPDVMRRAYFQLARELHPDQLGDAPADVQAAAAELFDRVRSAWEILGDDEKREAYIARTIRGEMSEDERTMERVRAILDAENDFKRGVADLNAGRLPAAHELFSRAHVAIPEEAEFAAYHGYTTFKLAHGRDEAAAVRGFEQLRAALKTNDKMDGAWVLLGMASRARGNDSAARSAFVTALKLKPSNPDAVREMRRLERDKESPPPAAGAGGLFSRLFGKKPPG
jgi:curved DNA-binding protein CbpA